MRAIAVLLAVVAACSQTPRDLGPFDIRFTLDTEAGRCSSASCDDYGMACGAIVSLRIMDLEAGDDVTTGELLYDECAEIAANQTVCDLASILSNTFPGIPPHRIRIEVAAWRPELIPRDATARPLCPSSEALFDLSGRPLESPTIVPAFAGSTVFDVGSDAIEAFVPLACFEPDQLDQDECAAGGSVFTAVIDDVETALTITEGQALGLRVNLAEPRARADGVDGTYFAIDAAGGIGLTLQPGPSPSFAEVSDLEVGAMLCTLTEEQTPLSTAAVMCETVDTSDPNNIDTRGVLVPKATLDDVLAALGGEFPEDGLLLGRVVDHTGAPLAGVSVTPSEGAVAYLSSDRASLIGTETTSSGFFVALDVPFDTPFTATHNSDGRREDGGPRAGLVRGHLTVMMLGMQAP